MRTFVLFSPARRTRHIKPLAAHRHCGAGMRGYSKLGIDVEKLITHRHAAGESVTLLAGEFKVSQSLIVAICERRKAVLAHG